MLTGVITDQCTERNVCKLAPHSIQISYYKLLSSLSEIVVTIKWVTNVTFRHHCMPWGIFASAVPVHVRIHFQFPPFPYAPNPPSKKLNNLYLCSKQHHYYTVVRLLSHFGHWSSQPRYFKQSLLSSCKYQSDSISTMYSWYGLSYIKSVS